jgi:hypothetical protein
MTIEECRAMTIKESRKNEERKGESLSAYFGALCFIVVVSVSVMVFSTTSRGMA